MISIIQSDDIGHYNYSCPVNRLHWLETDNVECIETHQDLYHREP